MKPEIFFFRKNPRIIVFAIFVAINIFAAFILPKQTAMSFGSVYDEAAQKNVMQLSDYLPTVVYLTAGAALEAVLCFCAKPGTSTARIGAISATVILIVNIAIIGANL